MLQPHELTAAVQDPNHPQHHFAVGTFLGTILAGLMLWQTQGVGGVLNPNNLAQLIAGIFQSFLQPGTNPAPQIDTPKP